MTYKFCGSQTEAKKQVGNAFPPIMAEAMFRTIAKTLEAFDKGFIGAEDDIDDIDSFLERKGVRLAPPPAPPRASFRPSPQPSRFSRYLVRDAHSGPGRSTPFYSSPFARHQVRSSQPSRTTAPSTHQDPDLLGGLFVDLTSSDNGDVRGSVEARASRRPSGIRDPISDIIETSSESEESESETDSEEDEDEEDEDSAWLYVSRR